MIPGVGLPIPQLLELIAGYAMPFSPVMQITKRMPTPATTATTATSAMAVGSDGAQEDAEAESGAEFDFIACTIDSSEWVVVCGGGTNRNRFGKLSILTGTVRDGTGRTACL